MLRLTNVSVLSALCSGPNNEDRLEVVTEMIKSEHENFTAYRNTCQIESDLQLDWDIQVDEHPVK